MDTLKTLFLCVLAFFCCSSAAGAEAVYDWNFKPSENNEPATTEPHYLELLEKYDGYYIGDTSEKKIYLTFDNGYENGCTPDILDVLLEKDVPAAFFVTGHYLESQADLIKRMTKEGHIVGNHSWNHPSLPSLSDEKVKKELSRVTDRYKEMTGETMRYLRPPQGKFSERTLRLAKQEGYPHIFWSFAYVDWHTNQSKGKQHAYDKVMARVHPGAILLLHSVSQDNAEALPDIIDDLQADGYQFASLDDLTGQDFFSLL